MLIDEEGLKVKVLSFVIFFVNLGNDLKEKVLFVVVVLYIDVVFFFGYDKVKSEVFDEKLCYIECWFLW